MPDIVEECNRFSREQGLWAGWTGLLALCMRQHHGAFSSLGEHVVEFAALTLHVAVVPALVLTLHGSSSHVAWLTWLTLGSRSGCARSSSHVVSLHVAVVHFERVVVLTLHYSFCT